MWCSRCKQLFSNRSIYIIHLSKCIAEKYGHEDGSDTSAADDSDADPMWLPDSVESHDSLSDIIEPQSSPVSYEQEMVSAEVRKFIDPSLLPHLESGTGGADSDNLNNEELASPFVDQIPDIPEKPNNRSSRSEKIKALQIEIEQWKSRKREAFKNNKKSQARRIVNRIKGLENQIHEEEITTLQESRTGGTEGVDFNEDAIEPPSSDQEPGTFGADSVNFNEEEVSPSSDQEETRKQSSGRKKNFCLYCKKLVTNYCRHVENVHPGSAEGLELLSINSRITDPKLRKIAKQNITDKLRKLSNASWNAQVVNHMQIHANPSSSNMNLIPVKLRHSHPNRSGQLKDSVQCMHCCGMYKRNRLHVHIKKSCKEVRISPIKSPKKGKVEALREHALPLIPENKHVTEEVKKEVLNFMNSDEIATVAKTDSLILQMGSEFHKSRRDYTERNYCSREMRDMAKLLIELRKLNYKIKQMKDCFNPAFFPSLIKAVEILNGYDPKTGSVRVAGLAYRLLQPLKNCLRLQRKNITESVHSINSKDRTEIVMLNDFEQLLKDNWANQLGRHSLRSLKKGKTLKTQKMALEKDIKTLCGYINSKYNEVIENLKKHPKDGHVYNELVDMLLSHVMCLARRRPIDLTRGTLDHYKLLDSHDELVNMIKDNPLGENDIEQCKKFHIFFVPGKKYDTVPIVFTEPMKQAMETLIEHRNCVGIKETKIFVHAHNKPIDPSQSLERMKRKVVLDKPKDLTGNGLRHQAATFSKLHSTHPLYQDHLATTLGHTLYVHKKNYDLPTSIAQKLIVCPVLHKMTTGTDEKAANSEEETSRLEEPSTSTDIFNPFTDVEPPSPVLKKPKIQRKKWNESEKKAIFETFGKDILKGQCPSRNNIVLFKKSCNVLCNRTVPQVCTFVNNAAKRKMSNVSPNAKKYKKI